MFAFVTLPLLVGAFGVIAAIGVLLARYLPVNRRATFRLTSHEHD